MLAIREQYFCTILLLADIMISDFYFYKLYY